MTVKHRLVAVALGFLGGSWIAYGDITAPFPGIAPIGWLMVPAGVAAVVIAGALYLGWPWARWPGIILAIALLVLPQLAYGWAALQSSGLDLSAGLTLAWAVPGLWIACVLSTPWPVRGAEPATHGEPPG
jgi:hypothetical protein